ncbi:hypothetical protein L9F63_022705 [Diploptera punctata]|uniref:Transmembrane protein n=1 Tax=Diploptera punctata TaxID=6984 RepID=A0AAD8EAQ1_DIPPU|nr:hypothetical protein L9F63_022705 [Diploptera punctata]
MAHCKAEISFRMTRTTLYFAILFLIVSSSVDAWERSSKQVYSRGGRSYNENYQQKSANLEDNQNTKTKSYGGVGAWGYVAIILTVICTGMGIYYFTLFYPILCKKERNYDVMEMGSIAKNGGEYVAERSDS